MMTRSVTAELVTGRMVGPYRLLFRLGKGGMGEVWAAQRGGQFGFERLVALKLLRGAELDSNAAVMFFDEARAAAALQHAAIVPTFDLGQYGSTFYIAMGMVRGPSLTALLQRLAVKKQPVPPAIVAYIGERLASALDYANERAEIDGKKLRLIHRDVSPHNVLLDESGNALLSDFGVARTAVQDHESRVGTVRGKPSYMAPEQVTGGSIDARTDIFALGIVLYESSCVKRLFGRSNPVKSMEAVVHYQPKPLPDLVPGYPESLWRVIEKALEKDPTKRFQNAAELSRALNDVARTLPGSAAASRDLSTLIDESFPPGSFDVDARVREALAQGEATSSEVLEATRYERRPSGSGLTPMEAMLPVAAEAPFAELLGTRVEWPSAQGSDPLDPDALAEVQAALTSASSIPPQPLFTPTSSSPSFISYSQISGSSGVVPPKASKSLGKVAAGAMVIAALVAVGVAWAVVQQKDTLDTSTVPATPHAAPVARPGATAVAAETKTDVQRPATPVQIVEPIGADDSNKAKNKKPPVVRKEKAVEPQPRKEKEDTPRATEPAGPATRAEVFGLISKLEAIDPTQASAMKATLAESGGNASTLEMLKRQALAALRAAEK